MEIKVSDEVETPNYLSYSIRSNHERRSMIPEPSTKIIVSGPSRGVSPSGFLKVHLEMLPREAIKLVGYDPRSLVRKVPRPPKDPTKAPRKPKEVPHNVSEIIAELQNKVQRSVDKSRISEMVQYLANAQEHGKFADWGAIDVVTTSEPDFVDGRAELDSDAEYFVDDGQHRYCALLDFVQEYPQYADNFTQGITISVMPAHKLVEWAGQAFHDKNYYSVPVRAGKALGVDSRDAVNALAKLLDQHSSIVQAGGVAYDRDTLLAGDKRFASHSTLHRFVRGFLFGRSGLDKGTESVSEVTEEQRKSLWEYVTALAEVLPWVGEDRDSYLARTSVVMAALAVIGHDIYNRPVEFRVRALTTLAHMDWKRRNLGWVGIVGSEKAGMVQPNSSRQAIDSTIRYLRERTGIIQEQKP